MKTCWAFVGMRISKIRGERVPFTPQSVKSRHSQHQRRSLLRRTDAPSASESAILVFLIVPVRCGDEAGGGRAASGKKAKRIGGHYSMVNKAESHH